MNARTPVTPVYTGAASAASVRAARHASEWGRSPGTATDLFLALLDADAAGIAGAILDHLDVDILAARREVVACRSAETIDIAMIVEHALVESTSPRIGTDHLLIGLLADRGVAGIMRGRGVGAEEIRAARTALLTVHCYGCAEGDRRSETYAVESPSLSADLTHALTEIERWRREKEDAVDAGDYVRAGQMREQEKRARAVREWDAVAARAGLGEALNEILRLRAVVTELTGLLHVGHGSDYRRIPAHRDSADEQDGR